MMLSNTLGAFVMLLNANSIDGKFNMNFVFSEHKLFQTQTLGIFENFSFGHFYLSVSVPTVK